MPDYRSSSNGDVSQFKKVFVTQVDLRMMRCEVQDARGNSKFFVTINQGVGLFMVYPSQYEEWIVNRVDGQWSLYARTGRQNPAILKMREAEPGDVILNAQGSIHVISPLVQANITNRWQVPSFTLATTIGGQPTITSNVNEIAVVDSSNRLKMLQSGTFAVSFYVLANSVTATRASIRIDVNTLGQYTRRSNFPGETIGQVEGVLPLEKDDLLLFNIIHYSGSDRTFSGNIEITKVR